MIATPEKNKKLEEEAKTTVENTFECSICLEMAKEPVLTQCGHLFCWSCIF